MAKRLNKGLVATLTFVAFGSVIAISVLLIAGLKTQDPKHFVELAKQSAQRTDYEEAALFYQKAYEISRDPSYLIDKGEQFLNRGDIRRAIGSYKEAIANSQERSPQRIEAHEKSVELVLTLARWKSRVMDWEGVRRLAEELLNEDGQNHLGLAARGLAMTRLATQDPSYAEEGLADMKDACRLAPEELEYALDLMAHYVDLVREARTRGDEDQARAVANELQALIDETMTLFSAAQAEAGRVPWADAARLRWERAWHLASQDRLDEADAMFQKAIEMGSHAIDPEDRVAPRVEYASYLSSRWLRTNDRSSIDPLFAEADRLLRESIVEAPDSFEAYIQRADNLLNIGEYEQAIALCEQRLPGGFERRGVDGERQKDHYTKLLLLASRGAYYLAINPTNSAAEKAKQLDRAEDYINRAVAEYPDSPMITAQIGRIRLARGDDRGALDLLARADSQFEEDDLLDWETKTVLARIHLSLKAPGAAIKVLEGAEDAAQASESYFEFWTLLAQAHMDANHYEQALQLVTDNVLRIEPDHQTALRIKMKALTFLDRLDEAEDESGRVLGDQKSKFILDAERLRREGDLAGMIGKLREALRLDPTDKKLLELTMRFMMGQGMRDEAVELVDNALAVLPDDRALQRLRVTVAPGLTLEERREQIAAIIETEEDEYTRVTQLAEFHYNNGDLDKVLPLLDRAEALLTDPTFFEATGRRAEKAMHRDVLKMKMLAAAQLDDQAALAAAADSATRHNVDGVNGSTFRGQYHMYREEAPQAIVAFNEAITKQPDNVEALCYLGRCYQMPEQPRTADARACFEKAAELNPNSFLAHKGLAQLAFDSGETDVYRHEINECRRIMLVEGRERRDPWVSARLQELNEEKDPAAAIAQREAALPETPPAPSDREAHMRYQANLARLAQLHETVEDWEAAEKYYRMVYELDPGDRTRVLGVSGFYLRSGKPDAAEAVLTEYLNSRPTPEMKALAMLPLAAMHLETGDTEEAGRVLHEAVDLSPTFEVVRALGDYYLKHGRPREALPWLNQAVEKAEAAESPRLASTMSARIGCLLHERLNDLDTAEERVNEYRRAFPQDATGFYWEAEVRARHGEIPVAVEALTRYLDKRPDSAFIRYERARRYLALGRTPQAIQDLEQLIRNDPESKDLQPRIMLAQIYEESGQRPQARRVREAMVEAAPDSVQAVTELVKDYLDTKELTKAERLLTSRINRASADPVPDWFFLRAHVASRHNDGKRAINDLKRGVELGGFSPVRVATILDWFLELGMPAEGARYYEQHRSRFPSSAALESRYALLLARANEKEEAIQQFRRAMGLALREGYGSIRTVHSGLRMAFPIDEANDLLTNVPVDDPGIERVNERLLLSVLISRGATADADAKIRQLLQGAGTDAERAGLFAEQGMMYQMGGRYENACKAYEEALKYDPDHALVLNNLAFILSDELKRHETAIPYAERAVELHPMPEVIDTLGWIHVRLGDCRQGIADLSRALKADASQPIIWYHLGEAYRRCGEFEVATSVLSTGLGIARRGNHEELVAEIDRARRRAAKNDDTP